MPSCRKCSAVTSPTSWAQHQSLYHAWKRSQRTKCRDCAFESDRFPQSAAHCLLEGHSLILPSRMLLDLAWELRLNDEESEGNWFPGEEMSTPLMLEPLQTDVEENYSIAVANPVDPKQDLFVPLPAKENESVIALHRTARLPSSDSENDSVQNLRPPLREHVPRTALEGEVSLNQQSSFKCENLLSSSLESPQPSIKENHSKTQGFVQNLFPYTQVPKLSLAPKCKETSLNPFSYNCEKCGKRLQIRSSSHMTDHARACCSIRPFSCSKCGRASSQFSAVKSHIRRMCPEAEVRKVEDKEADRKALEQCFAFLNKSGAFSKQ